MASNTSLPSHDTVDNTAIMNNITIILYTITIIIGITGNSLVIWVASKHLKPNVTNVWLVNLAVADLIFCFTLVPSLLRKLFFDHWPFGAIICKFSGFFKYTNMFCSVFFLAVISVDRVLCIWRPLFTRERRTLCAARVVSVGVWIVAVIFSSPYYVYRQVYPDDKNLSKCSMEEKEASKSDNSPEKALYIIRFLCGFLLPFLVILCCYILAGFGIRRTRFSGKTRPLRILAGLVFAFFICWGPYHCLLLAKMVYKKSQAVKVGLSITKGFAFFNSCVNPVLYFCMGLDVRQRFRQSISGILRRALTEEGHTLHPQEGIGEESCNSFPKTAEIVRDRL
ncbi:C3a anaphylatoxin chemotactic receptor-like [Carassius auratus]|uniref:C3a anaphylatoxin chemotactic receptor-like n=1 Tax=Carassius auratus TaxID=7957 RepID=A0A6P6P1T2_CARAU|nr:C3a anaphylatoxin chemotactic receptor-like [Carassius auratus]